MEVESPHTIFDPGGGTVLPTAAILHKNVADVSVALAPIPEAYSATLRRMLHEAVPRSVTKSAVVHSWGYCRGYQV